ncbi:MAG: AMP-binding protein [Bosea sp.]|jgi:hypothetical protein|nr:AMP-binding protein [Bosea sp. (in: a-proteobacteria)]
MSAQRKPTLDLEGIGLDSLVAMAVRRRPGDIFLREPLRRSQWAGSDGQNLSFAEIDQRATRLAGLLSLSRLPERSQALILAPMGSDMLLAMIGALRAGLRPMLLPLSARTDQLRHWLDVAGPSVALASTRCGDIEPARMMRDAAARSFNPRLVCAFGPDAPDGVVPLDHVLGGAGETPPPPTVTSPPGIMTIGIETAEGARLVLTESDLLAAAMEIAKETRLSQEGRVLSLMTSPGLCALAAGPYLALLTGAEYMPLGLFSLSALWAGLSDGRPTCLIAPGGVEAALRSAGIVGHKSISAIVMIHRAPQGDAPERDAGAGRILDLYPQA